MLSLPLRERCLGIIHTHAGEAAWLPVLRAMVFNTQRTRRNVMKQSLHFGSMQHTGAGITAGGVDRLIDWLIDELIDCFTCVFAALSLKHTRSSQYMI